MDGALYFLFIIAAIFSIYAQSKVNSTFSKYSRVANLRGYTGADVARLLLNQSGIDNVNVEQVSGKLTDHYDPRTNTIRLSQSVYSSNSIAALGVAAHETGHAIQHNKGYLPLEIRSNLFPIVNLGNKLAMPMIIIGFLLYFMNFGIIIAQAGIILFSLVVLFQFITLPVEFNASARAINMLQDYGYLTREEIGPVKKVLSAAAMTYVAAAAVALLNLLRLISIANRRR